MNEPSAKQLPPAITILKLFGVLFSSDWIEDWQKRWREAQRLSLLENAEQSQKPFPRFYQRIFSLNVTLWYFIYQRLNSGVTQAAVMIDLRAGGADRLGRTGSKKLSAKSRSTKTAAYNQARQRMPLELLQAFPPFATIPPPQRATCLRHSKSTPRDS